MKKSIARNLLQLFKYDTLQPSIETIVTNSRTKNSIDDTCLMATNNNVIRSVFIFLQCMSLYSSVYGIFSLSQSLRNNLFDRCRNQVFAYFSPLSAADLCISTRHNVMHRTVVCCYFTDVTEYKYNYFYTFS